MVLDILNIYILIQTLDVGEDPANYICGKSSQYIASRDSTIVNFTKCQNKRSHTLRQLQTKRTPSDVNAGCRPLTDGRSRHHFHLDRQAEAHSAGGPDTSQQNYGTGWSVRRTEQGCDQTIQPEPKLLSLNQGLDLKVPVLRTGHGRVVNLWTAKSDTGRSNCVCDCGGVTSLCCRNG